jgi:hypothetical protein
MSPESCPPRHHKPENPTCRHLAETLAQPHGIGKVTFNGAIMMRIRPPLPPDRLRSYYEEAARRFGVPWTLLAAINPDGSLSADAEGLELADCRPRYRRGHGVALRFEQR